jgi:hypothetical protein
MKTVMDDFAAVGVNPLGVHADFQRDENGRQWWYITKEQRKYPDNYRYQEERQTAFSHLILEAFVARNYFSSEASGVGLVVPSVTSSELRSCASIVGVSDSAISDLLARCVRLLGDKHRYDTPRQFVRRGYDFGQPEALNFNTDTYSPLKVLLERYSVYWRVEYAVLKQALAPIFDRYMPGQKLVLQELSVVIAKADDPVYLCSGCRRPHLSKGAFVGFCSKPKCASQLEPVPHCDVMALRMRNYYSKRYFDTKPNPTGPSFDP